MGEEAALAAAELQKENARACAQAEEALEKGRKGVADAKAHVRAYGTDLRRAKRYLEKRTKQLGAFRSGPLAAFEAMWSEAHRDQKDEAKGTNEEIKSNAPDCATGHAGGSSDDDDDKRISKAASLSLTVPDENAGGHAEETFRESELVASPVCDVGAGERGNDDDGCEMVATSNSPNAD